MTAVALRASPDGEGQPGQVIAHQHHVGGLEGGVRAGAAHGHAHRGGGQRRGVVHAVAHHRHPPCSLPSSRTAGPSPRASAARAHRRCPTCAAIAWATRALSPESITVRRDAARLEQRQDHLAPPAANVSATPSTPRYRPAARPPSWSARPPPAARTSADDLRRERRRPRRAPGCRRPPAPRRPGAHALAVDGLAVLAGGRPDRAARPPRPPPRARAGARRAPRPPRRCAAAPRGHARRPARR